MEVDTLVQLEKAYARWRRGKRYVREGVPKDLLERTHRAAAKFGDTAVSKAIKIDWRRLSKKSANRTKINRKNKSALPIVLPTYSRVELQVASMPEERPFAELETPTGMKVRFFSAGPEALALLSSLCSGGGFK